MGSRLFQRVAQREKSVWNTTAVDVPKEYNAATVIPLTRIKIYPGVVSYEELMPLITADGAPVSATSEGTWGQLYAAGRRL
jgi:hypothetical protein